jgi:Patatin-like phospholipase
MGQPFNLDEEVKRRRSVLNEHAARNGKDQVVPVGSGRKWGLALSGGGIRSATFSLGVLRGLAHKQALSRFDLLSTVSGGGYVGAMLGRLYARASGPEDVDNINRALSGKSATWFIWWLRANGRYLVPQGMKDITFALAVYVRNLLAVHIELGIIGLLLGCFLTSFDLGVWALLDQAATHRWLAFEQLRPLRGLLPTTWLLLPPLAFYAACLASAHWSITWVAHASRLRTSLYWSSGAAACLVTSVSYYLLELLPGNQGSELRNALWNALVILLLSWLVGIPMAAQQLRKAKQASTVMSLQLEEARSKLTKRLATSFSWMGVVALAGVLDRLAWFLSFEAAELAASGTALGVMFILIRTVLPHLVKKESGVPTRVNHALVLNLLGLALAFWLATWWVSLAHRVVLGSLFGQGLPNYPGSIAVLASLLLPLSAYLLATGRNFSFLNLSSLHSFYRARLVRTYLGASNAHRFSRDEPSILASIDDVPSYLVHQHGMVSVKDTHPDDDIGMLKYRPQDVGGPVHLINVCINQTTDPRGQIFNQDRKGLPLTIASGGAAQIALAGWDSLGEEESLTLGTWAAISGAAVSSGMGALTNGGTAALTTLTGLRLGYWWSRSPQARARSRLSKARSLLEETLGAFQGTAGENWYLSDGGHFENTAAYALLAARAEVIVLVDCGADPAYRFGDLENLVRKARIDLQAEICFKRLRNTKPIDELRAFGSLSDLASEEGSACLALAEISYHGKAPGRGILLLIKPNVSDGLQVDLRNFKKANPLFPQESTADQSFSESQWESYFSLGQHLGQKIDRHLIELLLRDAGQHFSADENSPLTDVTTSPRDSSADAPKTNLRAVNATVRTTLSLGAVATIGVSVWQGIESWQNSVKAQRAEERAALGELTALWQKARTPLPQAASSAASSNASDDTTTALAAILLRNAEHLCTSDQGGWFKRSTLGQEIYRQTVKACGASPSTAACIELKRTQELEGISPYPACLANIAFNEPKRRLPANYWIYDYTLDGSRGDNHLPHPCDPENKWELIVSREAAGCDVAREHPVTRIEIEQTVAGKRKWASDHIVVFLKSHAPFLLMSDPDKASTEVTSVAASSAAISPTNSPSRPQESSSVPVLNGTECVGKTVYMQIYGGGDRNGVRALREPWRALGANVPAIEDVWATAAARGRTKAEPVATNTIRYHTASDMACANALKVKAMKEVGKAWQIQALAPGLTATPGTIEVWFKKDDFKPEGASTPASSTP